MEWGPQDMLGLAEAEGTWWAQQSRELSRCGAAGAEACGSQSGLVGWNKPANRAGLEAGQGSWWECSLPMNWQHEISRYFWEGWLLSPTLEVGRRKLAEVIPLVHRPAGGEATVWIQGCLILYLFPCHTWREDLGAGGYRDHICQTKNLPTRNDKYKCGHEGNVAEHLNVGWCQNTMLGEEWASQRWMSRSCCGRQGSCTMQENKAMAYSCNHCVLSTCAVPGPCWVTKDQEEPGPAIRSSAMKGAPWRTGIPYRDKTQKGAGGSRETSPYSRSTGAVLLGWLMMYGNTLLHPQLTPLPRGEQAGMTAASTQTMSWAGSDHLARTCQRHNPTLLLSPIPALHSPLHPTAAQAVGMHPTPRPWTLVYPQVFSFPSPPTTI